MSWSPTDVRMGAEFGGGRAVSNQAPRAVSIAAGSMVVRGYVQSIDEHVVVVDTRGGAVRIGVDQIRLVIPIPDGQKP